MSPHNHENHHGCCGCGMNRRDFMAAAGASAAALRLGALALTVALSTESPQPRKNPRIRVAFVRPDADHYWNTWPGTDYNPKARQAEYVDELSRTAQALGVDLDVHEAPLADGRAVDALVRQVKNDPSDGVILVVQILNGKAWGSVRQFLETRGDVPAFVFAQQGTFFLDTIQSLLPLAIKTKAFIAATPDQQWLSFGLRALATIRQMKDTRICVVQGSETIDVPLAPVGSTLHYISTARFPEEFRKVADSDEVRALADHYTKNARKIVEPNSQDVLEAAKTYVVCRRLMEAENCQGIAVECLPFVAAKTAPPPCMAFSRLLDEGVVAACQADWPAAISYRLCDLLLGQPGFMNNTCISTTDNTRVGAHCTCPTRLAGADEPPFPFVLRSHSETNLGVALQVLWPENREVTIMKFSHPDWAKNPSRVDRPAASMLLGSGRVLRNIDTPPSGGCRTCLEVQVDGLDEVSKLNPLHHQLFVLGNHVRKLKIYCQLSGIESLPL